MIVAYYTITVYLFDDVIILGVLSAVAVLALIRLAIFIYSLIPVIG